MQEVKPVKQMRLPRYPNREAALAQPELLKLLPQRWRQCRQAAAAAGLLAAISTSATGCQASAASPFVTSTPEPTMGAVAVTSYMSESDALNIIQQTIKGKMTDAFVPCDTVNIAKPVVYVTYSGDQTGYQAVDIQNKAIDAYSAADGVGIEYISEDEQNDGLNYKDETLKIDKKNAYVLVMAPEGVYDGHTGETEIRRQVEDFLNWLKAEGIV